MQKTAGYRTLRWFHCSGKQYVSFAWRVRQQTAKSAAELSMLEDFHANVLNSHPLLLLGSHMH